MELPRRRNKLRKCEPSAAFRAVLVLAESRLRRVLHESHLLESHSRISRKTEEGRIVRHEVHHADVADRQLESGEHLESPIGVLALSEVFNLLRIRSAVFAR